MVRYYYAVFALLVIVLTAARVWGKLRELRDPPASRNASLYTVRMKRRAELAAVGALLAFIVPYFQQGLAFDLLVADQRLQRIGPIKEKINAALPPDFCQALPYRQLGCAAVAKDLDLLGRKIAYGPEADVATIVDRLSNTLLNGFRIKQDEMIHGELVGVVQSLHSLVIEGGILPALLPFLQLLSLLFAGYAFSSKVALAWHEVDKEKARQKKAKQEEAEKAEKEKAAADLAAEQATALSSAAAVTLGEATAVVDDHELQAATSSHQENH
ncbi:hypothetical protein [Duganella aceris]|uniref:Uncharacterized protein n=1 Tax=Duganella aceris TaxID=2703883 RepID=A0ABX0FKR4_9BURK|nr:hypothetical protein [Duganella aceris]NGZ85111.1 hypothetical protein [Duganella aceris]